MIPTRAIENNAWIAVANKVGLEAESVLYCGKSCIVSPQGRIVAQAGSEREEIVLAQIDLEETFGVSVRRRPECYHLLGEPTETLPVTALLSEPIVPASSTMRIGLLQLKPYASPQALLARVTALCETLVRQGAALLVLPGVPAAHTGEPAYQTEVMLQPLQDLSTRLGCGLACPLISSGTDGKRRKSVYLVSSGDVIGTYHQTHLSPEQGGEWEAGGSLPVWDTPYGRIGIMLDDEGLVPEVARVLMLQGADLILWPAASSRFPLRMIARTRADENRVWVAHAAPLQGEGPASTALINPAGVPVASALPDVEHALAGQIAWALSRYKEMAPNTNVVLNRQPAAYRSLAS